MRYPNRISVWRTGNCRPSCTWYMRPIRGHEPWTSRSSQLSKTSKFRWRNIFGIIKAHYNIVKTRPSNVNCWNINAIGMGPTHAWPVLSSLIYYSVQYFFCLAFYIFHTFIRRIKVCNVLFSIMSMVSVYSQGRCVQISSLDDTLMYTESSWQVHGLSCRFLRQIICNVHKIDFNQCESFFQLLFQIPSFALNVTT